MVNEWPPATQPPPAAPPPVPLAPPMQLQAPPTQPAVPPVQLANPGVHQGIMPQLNWSHFKQKFAEKPDEDAEAQNIFTGQMIGWTLMHFNRVSKSKDLFNISRRS